MSVAPRLRPVPIDQYLVGEAGFAREVFVGPEAVIPLTEVGCELRLADVYANVGLAS